MPGRETGKGEPIMETQDTSPRPPTLRPRARKGLWLGLALLLGAGVASAALPLAQAHEMADGGGPGGFGGPGMFGGGFAFRVQRMLDKVGASDSQKGQIKAIWEGLRPQLKSIHQQHAQLHKQIAQAMTAPTIDPAAIEKLRQQSVQLMDKASSVITQGMVSTAQVLTPDQRKQVLAEIESHRHHGPGPGAAAGQ
jgi:protein CpxP